MAAYEDLKIKLSHDNEIAYDNTIRVTITSFDTDALINASANKSWVEWDFEGVGELVVPIIKSTALVVLINGERWAFPFEVSSQYDAADFDVAANGMHFQNPNKRNVGAMPWKTHVRLDTNKLVAVI